MGLKAGYVPGAFDMFHVGHLNILKRSRANCDYLIAGAVTDEVLERVKGRPPVVPLVERIEILQSVIHVDSVVADGTSDKYEMWKVLGFDVFFKGDDWKGTPRGARLEQLFAGVGVRVMYFPYTAHISTSQVRARIAAGAQ